MKLFNRKAGNKAININGKVVKFVNGIAEVDDKFGEEALKLGLPNLYEDGKQPVFETPKEIQMKSDFGDREEWYKKELSRLTNVNTSQKTLIKTLQTEVENWKKEYTQEHELRIKLAEGIIDPSEAVTNPVTDPAVTSPIEGEGGESSGDENPVLTPEQEEAALRKELSDMKKDDLIKFGTESGLDMKELSDSKTTKAEIIDFIISSSKGEE